MIINYIDLMLGTTKLNDNSISHLIDKNISLSIDVFYVYLLRLKFNDKKKRWREKKSEKCLD